MSWELLASTLAVASIGSAAASIPSAAWAQDRPSNEGATGQNTQNQKEPADPKTKARIRTQGAAGGTGDPVAQGKAAPRGAIKGKSHLHDDRRKAARQKKDE